MIEKGLWVKPLPEMGKGNYTKVIKYLYRLMLESIEEIDRESTLYSLFLENPSEKYCKGIIERIGFYVVIDKEQDNLPAANIRTFYDSNIMHEGAYIIDPDMLLRRGFYKEWAETQVVTVNKGYKPVFSLPVLKEDYLLSEEAFPKLKNSVYVMSNDIINWIECITKGEIEVLLKRPEFVYLFGTTIYFDTDGNLSSSARLSETVKCLRKSKEAKVHMAALVIANLYSEIKQKYQYNDIFHSTVEQFLCKFTDSFVLIYSENSHLGDYEIEED